MRQKRCPRCGIHSDKNLLCYNCKYGFNAPAKPGKTVRAKASGSGQIAPRTYKQQIAWEGIKGK